MPKEEIIDHFILEFLPAQSNKRKSKGNELSYIYSTLNTLFEKFFDIELSLTQLRKAFHRLGYENYELYNSYNHETKNDRMSLKPKSETISRSTRTKDRTESYDDYQIYNVSATQVRELNKCLRKLAPNTNADKAKRINELRKKIENFKETTLQATPT